MINLMIIFNEYIYVSLVVFLFLVLIIFIIDKYGEENMYLWLKEYNFIIVFLIFW